MTTPRRMLLLLLGSLLCVTLAFWLRAAARRLLDPVTVAGTDFGADEQPFASSPQLVRDEHAVFRVRRHAQAATWSSDAQGLIGARATPTTIPGPRILLLGDESLLDAARDDERLAVRVEGALRSAADRLAATHVLDASCPRAGLLQHALRLPTLVARYRPHAVVVVVASGDDLLAFEDRCLPHLDQDLQLRAPVLPPLDDPLGLAEMAARLASPPAFARRGLVQAEFAFRSPQWPETLPPRAELCLRTLRDAAPRGALLIVLLPAPELVEPLPAGLRLSADGERIAALGFSRRARGILLAAVEREHVAHLDALPVLADATGGSAFAADGALAPAGHAALAQALAARLRRLLAAL